MPQQKTCINTFVAFTTSFLMPTHAFLKQKLNFIANFKIHYFKTLFNLDAVNS